MNNFKKAREFKSLRILVQRLHYIHARVMSGKYPSASTLARERETCTKTIHRDLDLLRDFFKLPLAYDSRKYGWYYCGPVGSCPFCSPKNAKEALCLWLK